MRREFSQHKLAYTLLIGGLSLLTLLFLAAWPDLVLQRVVVVAMSAFYFFWGLITHVHADKITRRVVAEYVTVAVLAGVILLLVTF